METTATFEISNEYGGQVGRGRPVSAVLQKRLNKNVKYFDSGDYNVAIAERKMKAVNKRVVTGAATNQSAPANQEILFFSSTSSVVEQAERPAKISEAVEHENEQQQSIERDEKKNEKKQVNEEERDEKTKQKQENKEEKEPRQLQTIGNVRLRPKPAPLQPSTEKPKGVQRELEQSDQAQHSHSGSVTSSSAHLHGQLRSVSCFLQKPQIQRSVTDAPASFPSAANTAAQSARAGGGGGARALLLQTGQSHSLSLSLSGAVGCHGNTATPLQVATPFNVPAIARKLQLTGVRPPLPLALSSNFSQQQQHHQQNQQTHSTSLGISGVMTSSACYTSNNDNTAASGGGDAVRPRNCRPGAAGWARRPFSTLCELHTSVTERNTPNCVILNQQQLGLSASPSVSASIPVASSDGETAATPTLASSKRV